MNTQYPPVAILGGSIEAVELSRMFGDQARVWWPGTARKPLDFGSIAESSARFDGFGSWLSGARGLVMAPHPCAVEHMWAAARVAADLGVPTLLLRRPGWVPDWRDHWVGLRTVRDLQRYDRMGERFLVTLGRDALGELRGMRRSQLYLRQLNKTGQFCPLRHGRYEFGEAPFRVLDEVRLMRRLRITGVVSANAGGEGGWPKLEAARVLRIPVYLVARGRAPEGPVVESVAEAADWVRGQGWLDA